VPSASCVGGFGQKILRIRETNPSRRTLSLRLGRGPLLAQADFGDPTAPGGTAYHLCFYDETDVLWGALEVDRAGDACGARPCWSSVPGIRRTYRYRDGEAAASGLTSVKLQEGESRVIVKARSKPGLDLSGLPFLAEALAGAGTVRVQLFGSDAPVCLSDTLTPIVQTPALLVAR
jgi:hypothetical protein